LRPDFFSSGADLSADGFDASVSSIDAPVGVFMKAVINFKKLVR
jgi:hypothetical protein